MTRLLPCKEKTVAKGSGNVGSVNAGERSGIVLDLCKRNRGIGGALLAYDQAGIGEA